MLRALDLTKSYDGAPLFDGLSLTLNPGDRAGLVGPNGAGKSTLLRLLAGREQPDRGSVTRHATVGYLPQEAPDATLDELLHDALGEAGRTLAALHARTTSTPTPTPSTAPRPPARWAAESRAEEVRRRLAHRPPRPRPPAAAPLRRRAGPRAAGRHAARGPRRPAPRRAHQPPRRRRPRLARAVPGRASRARSSSSRTTGASSTPSSPASTSSSDELAAYDGGYTAYRDEKARRRARLEELATTQDKRRPQARGRHRRHPRARPPHRAHRLARRRAPLRSGYAKKVAKKAKAREHRLEREMASTDWVERPREAPAVRLKLDAAADRGRRVARLDGAGARILRDVDLTLHGGERVAITGANGAGKTTLLQLLLGTLAPAHGEVHTATTVRLLPQTFHATGSVMPQFERHRRERGAHAARPLRPRRRRDPPPARAPQPRSARPRRDRRAGREPGRPAAPRRAHQPPRLRHARGAGDRPREEPEHDRRRLPRPLVPGRDRRHAAAPRRGWRRLRAMLGRHGHLPRHRWCRFPRVASLR